MAVSSDPMPPLVYAVTLNWNRPQDTIECLDSLAAQTYPRLKLVVVDNGSTDDSVAQIQRQFPEVTVIAHPTNAGFAGGMNVGLRHALAHEAHFIFILNNDTYLAPDVVTRLTAAVSQDEVGIAAPIIYYADDPQRVWSLGAQSHALTLETTGSVRGQLDQGQWPSVVPCDFVPGCGMMFSRAALEQVHLFDERFFMYYEDADLCLRFRQKGWSIHSLPQAKMWHKVSLSSGGSDSANERYWMARSSVLYFRKHARMRQWPLIIFWRVGSAFRTTGRLLRHGRLAALRAYWRGLWHGLTSP